MENKYEQKLNEIQNKKAEEAANKNTTKKGIIKSIVALLLAGATLIGGYFLIKSGKNQNKGNDKEPVTMEDTLEPTIPLDELGEKEEDLKEEQKEFSNPSEGIDPNKVVEDNDGTIWKNQDAVNNKDKIGKEEIDLQGGELVINPDTGNVVKKEEDFVVNDQDGNTVVSGTNSTGTPEPNDGYVKDENTETIVEKEDVDKFAVVDADYYEVATGKLVYTKGEKVLKTTLDMIKNDQNLTTVKPEKSPEVTTPETTTPEVTEKEEVKQETGVINPDGTYTIYGRTYADKATFDAIMLNPENIVDVELINGVIHLGTKENTKTK